MYTNTLPDRLNCDTEVSMMFLLTAYQTADMLMMVDLQNKIVDFVLDTTRPFSLSYVTLFHVLNLVHTPFYLAALMSSVRSFITTPPDDDRCFRHIEELAKYPTAWKDVLSRINDYNRKPWIQVDRLPRYDFHIHSVPTSEVTCRP